MNSPSPTSKFIWVPRILAILFFLFLMLFSLDVFDMPGSLLEKIGGFLVHSLPSIIMLTLLILFWKHPLWSGLSMIGFSIFFTLAFGILQEDWIAILFLSLLPFLIGVMFLFAHRIQAASQS